MIRYALTAALLVFAATAADADPGSRASISVSIIGTAAGPTITFVPALPSIDTTAALGATVASYSVTMPDGSPSPGTVQFGPPYFDAGGLFAMTGTGAAGEIIVNPAGPGLSGLAAPITEWITLQAVTP